VDKNWSHQEQRSVAIKEVTSAVANQGRVGLRQRLLLPKWEN